jgi:hypothetical protein
MDDELAKLEYTVGKIRISTENRVFFDDMNDFVRAVKTLCPGMIMVTASDRNPKPMWFEFAYQGFVYRTASKGYKRLEDFLDSISQNIQDGSKYYDMRKGGFADQDQLNRAKKLGYQSQEELDKSEALGFSGCMRLYNETYKKLKESSPVAGVQKYPMGATVRH